MGGGCLVEINQSRHPPAGLWPDLKLCREGLGLCQSLRLSDTGLNPGRSPLRITRRVRPLKGELLLKYRRTPGMFDDQLGARAPGKSRRVETHNATKSHS